MKKVLSLLLALSLVFGVIYSSSAFTVTASDDVKAEDSNNIYSVIAYGNGNGTYLHGSYYEPSNTANAMTEIEPGIWEIIMDNIDASDNYNIMFAVNWVDENGNPTNNSFLLGVEANLEYPTGEPINAKYYGKSCIFKVKENKSIITFRLDFRNYNYTTKEGAVFTITVDSEHPVHIPASAVKENVIPATCTAGGSYDSVVYCSKCGDEISRTSVDIPAKGHSSSGVSVRENDIIADCEHRGSYDLVDYCCVCHKEIRRNHYDTTNYGHSIRYTAQIPATEDADGVEAHFECVECGKVFSDQYGQNEVTAESLVIKKLQPATEPPTEEPTTVEPTTEPDPGETFTVNTVSNLFDGATKTYSYKTENGMPNTVTITYYADLTGLRLQTAQFAIEYDPNHLSFNPDNNGVYDSDSGNFDYSQMFPVTRGTGYVNYVKEGRLKFAFANKKGFPLKQDGKLVPIAKVVFTVINSSGSTDVNNNFEVLSFLEDSTSNEYVVCSNSEGIDKDNYDYVTSLSTGEYGALFSVIDHIEVIDEGYAATCTEDGLTDGSHCAICGDVIKAQKTIPAKGHITVYDSAVNATCTEDGLTDGSHCAICGDVIKAQKTIPAKGHITVYDSAVNATCTETGLTWGSHCSVCNEVIVAQEVIPANGHTTVKDRAFAPTCTRVGLTEGSHCSVCGEVINEQQVVPATGHTSVTDSAIAPSCNGTGYTEGSHCSKCGKILVARQIVPAKGHTPVVDPAVPATCSQYGFTEGSHCSDCGEIFVAQQQIPTKLHTYVVDPGIPNTCTENGLTEGVHCSVCNKIIIPQNIIPASHSYITDKAVEPTCTKTGLTEGFHCRECGDVLIAQQVIPALGHQDTYDVPGRAATYSSTGLTDGVFCRTCNNWAVPQEVIPKLVPSHPIGDLTGDDKIDVLDALDIQKYAAEEITLNEEEFYIADVNNDGYVDVLDSILIQKYAAELINTFPKTN